MALICLAGRQPGKLRAIRYRNYLFVLMNRASFELSLSPSPRISVGNMKIRWKFYNFTIFSRNLRIVRKIRKFEKFCYNYCVRVQQPIVTSVAILNIFFDILTKVGCIVHERTGVYSKHFTPRKERNAFNLGRWNFSRTFLLDASLLRACFKYERNYHTKRDSVVKISGRKTWKKRERKFMMITERFNL